MRAQVKRVGRIAAGILLLILGVIGLFLPFLQGILFLILGLTVLSKESEMARRWLSKLRQSTFVPERWREMEHAEAAQMGCRRVDLLPTKTAPAFAAAEGEKNDGQ